MGWANGTRYGVLSSKIIKEIINLFKEKKFLCLHDNYEPFFLFKFTDAGRTHVTLTIDSVIKTVEDYGSSAPSAYKEIVEEMREVAFELPVASSDEERIVCEVIFNEMKKVPYIKTTYSHWMDVC